MSVPEIHNYWPQGGRVDVGLLGAAGIDRFAGITSVHSGVRLEDVWAATTCDLRTSDPVSVMPAPTVVELDARRAMTI